MWSKNNTNLPKTLLKRDLFKAKVEKRKYSKMSSHKCEVTSADAQHGLWQMAMCKNM